MRLFPSTTIVVMELGTSYREAGLMNWRGDCCCTSRSIVGDGWAAISSSGFPTGTASPARMKSRTFSCTHARVVSVRKSGHRPELWRRNRFSFQEECWEGIGDAKLSVNRFRVRVLDEGSDPLGPGYWDRAEGMNQMAEIEDMKELVAEAERLKKGRQTEAETQEGREERARQEAAILREQLAQRAREQAENRKTAEKMYQLGQTAYARGMYDKSVELFEGALLNVQASTNLGGEIQIWLAMAYDANNRHDDCIALYKRLEARHPSKQIKRQAADLRYILEAPKLKISREEMVTIPIIERDYDKTQSTYSQKLRDRRRPKSKVPKQKDYLEDWLVFELPPRWERSPYFWVALTVWLTLCGIALMFQD